MKKTWIITGGAGFIGANFVKLALEETEAQVVVLDKLTYAGHLESLDAWKDHPRFTFERGDITDRAFLADLFERTSPTAVLNFAAESHVDRSIDGPGEFIQTNIVGTFALLEAARALLSRVSPEHQETFRFLHVSTDEVYGSLGPEGLFEETTPYAPNSPYAASKAAADHLVRSWGETFGVPVVITNCSNNYGPFQFPEKLIPLMIMNALVGKDLPIYGDGLNVRDWLYVKDHCRGILLALERGRLGEKYNIGGRNERTNIQIVDTLCEALNEHRPAAENPHLQARGFTSYEDLKTFVRDRPGHDQRYAIDATKIREELGWEPRYNFDTGIRETVRWYLEQDSWCRAVMGETYDGGRLGLGEQS